MAVIKLNPFFIFWMFMVFICCCDAAKVQFYWEHDFEGAVYEANSSTSCKNLPNGSSHVNGSIRTTGCIAIFQLPNCDEKYNGENAFVVKSEENRLNELPWKYDDVMHSGYAMSSFRDCTDMEKRPQSDFDIFARDYFKGQKNLFRDICSCTNLGVGYITWKYRSAKTYGNCFKMYSTKECEGLPLKTRHNTHYSYLPYTYRSIEPCHPAQLQCNVRFKGKIYGIDSNPDISKPTTIIDNVRVAEKEVFFNKGSSPIERYFEASKEISEELQFQLINATHSINSFTFEESVSLDFGPTIPTHLSNQSEAIIQAFKSNGEAVSRRKLIVREKLTLPPCTKLEVNWLIDTAELENEFDVNLKLTATIQGSKRMEAKFIRHYFESLNFTQNYDDYTADAETPAIFRVKLTTGTRINVTTEPIPDCPQWDLSLVAQVTKIYLVTEISNLTQEHQKLPMSNTQTFINNGITLQEKTYKAEMEVAEMGQFEFSIKLNQTGFVGFHEDLQVDEVPSIPFLTDVWAKLQSGETPQEKNETATDTTYKYIVRSSKTWLAQKNITVSPCTEYDVESFIKVVKNVEIDYKIQLQVTGQLYSQPVDVETIRENLEGLTFVRNEDNVTVVVETTGKLVLNYVVGTEVGVEVTPVLECYERYAEVIENC